MSRSTSNELDSDEDEDTDAVDESDAASDKKPSKRGKLARLKSRAKQRAYELSGYSELAGVLFLEITKVTDLPPERNSMCCSWKSWTVALTNLHSDTH